MSIGNVIICYLSWLSETCFETCF